jgi:hypothetical protein
LYSELLARVHRRLTEWAVDPSPEEDGAFGASVGDWPPFPDTPAALTYLKRFYKLVILSNVDRASFARSNPRLGVEFIAIYTAQDIGSYKPDPGNFRYMLVGPPLSATGRTRSCMSRRASITITCRRTAAGCARPESTAGRAEMAARRRRPMPMCVTISLLSASPSWSRRTRRSRADNALTALSALQGGEGGTHGGAVGG